MSEDVAAMAFVQSSALCQGLPAAMLSRLFAGGEVVDYVPGSVICEEGGTDDHLYVVFDGGVSIQKSHAKTRVEIAAIERQGIFGEIAVLTRMPCPASAVARIDTRLVRLNGNDVRAVADLSPKLGRKLAALMAGRSRDADRKRG